MTYITIKMQLHTGMKKSNARQKQSIVLPDKKMGLLCSVIGLTVGFEQGKWVRDVWEITTEGKERHWNEINGTKIGKAFAENQHIIECFAKASR